MLQFIIRRSISSLLILAGVMILTFVLFRVAAGDPTSTLLGKNPKPEEVESLRKALGADRPLFYGKFLRTEAFTNAVFERSRSSFTGVTVNGDAQPSRDGLLISGGAEKTQIVFRRNFVPEGNTVYVEVIADGQILVNGRECQDRTEITADAGEIVITPRDGSVKIRAVSFYRLNPEPWDSQFLASLGEIVSFRSTFPYISFFNFGNTLQTREPIRGKLWRGMWPSLMLMLPVFFGELLLGIVLAMISCVWHGRWIDRVIMVISVAGMSISYLALIIFGQWLLGYYWNWFPVWGWGGTRYLVLPVIIGIISGTGSGVRFYRTVFLNECNREYLRTAVAKGASPVTVYGRHMLKNALIPIITRASGILPFLFTGSLLLESFFGIPGLGSEGINALHDADLQMLKALVILSSFLFVLINLLTDIAYAWADPRMRITNRAK